jgi:hypothetical protein
MVTQDNDSLGWHSFTWKYVPEHLTQPTRVIPENMYFPLAKLDPPATSDSLKRAAINSIICGKCESVFPDINKIAML